MNKFFKSHAKLLIICLFCNIMPTFAMERPFIEESEWVASPGAMEKNIDEESSPYYSDEQLLQTLAELQKEIQMNPKHESDSEVDSNSEVDSDSDSDIESDSDWSSDWTSGPSDDSADSDYLPSDEEQTQEELYEFNSEIEQTHKDLLEHSFDRTPKKKNRQNSQEKDREHKRKADETQLKRKQRPQKLPKKAVPSSHAQQPITKHIISDDEDESLEGEIKEYISHNRYYRTTVDRQGTIRLHTTADDKCLYEVVSEINTPCSGGGFSLGDKYCYALYGTPPETLSVRIIKLPLIGSSFESYHLQNAVCLYSSKPKDYGTWYLYRLDDNTLFSVTSRKHNKYTSSLFVSGNAGNLLKVEGPIEDIRINNGKYYFLADNLYYYIKRNGQLEYKIQVAPDNNPHNARCEGPSPLADHSVPLPQPASARPIPTTPSSVSTAPLNQTFIQSTLGGPIFNFPPQSPSFAMQHNLSQNVTPSQGPLDVGFYRRAYEQAIAALGSVLMASQGSHQSNLSYFATPTPFPASPAPSGSCQNPHNILQTSPQAQSFATKWHTIEFNSQNPSVVTITDNQAHISLLQHPETLWTYYGSPTGEKIATVNSQKNKIYIWYINRNTNQLIKTYDCPQTIDQVLWNSSGDTLLIKNGSHLAIINDLVTISIDVPASHTSIKWHRNGNTFSIQSIYRLNLAPNRSKLCESIKIYDKNGSIIATKSEEIKNPVFRMYDWVPAGTKVALIDANNIAKIMYYSTSAGLWAIEPLKHDGRVIEVSWNNTGNQLATLSEKADQKILTIWEKATWENVTKKIEIPHPSSATSMRWLQDNRIAIYVPGQVIIYTLHQGYIQHEVIPLSPCIEAILDPTGTFVVCRDNEKVTIAHKSQHNIIVSYGDTRIHLDKTGARLTTEKEECLQSNAIRKSSTIWHINHQAR